MNEVNKITIPKGSKIIHEDEYFIAFDPNTGFEMTTGINGHPDPFVLKRPNLMDIGIMGHCLNNCPMCYQGEGDDPNMSLDNYNYLMGQVSTHVNQVALGGRGDPNLHEDFEGILKTTREHTIVPSYTTSGNGLTDEAIAVTKKYCGAVAVSEYNEDFTYSAIQRFMDAGCKTNIHFVLSRDRIQRAKDILMGYDVFDGKVDMEKLNAVVFLLFKPQGKGADLPDWIPTEQQLKEFFALVNDVSRGDRKISFKIGMDSCLVNHKVNLKMTTPQEEIMLDTCEGARYSCYVTSTMLFKPCSFGNNDTAMCLKTHTIQDVWDNSEAFNEFRDTLKENAACCPYFK